MSDGMDERIEQFEYGIKRIWRHNEQLLIIETEGNMTRAAIDVWAEVVIEGIQSWSAEPPMLILHNLSHKKQGVTPYSLKRAEDTYKAIPEKIQVYAAVVLVETLFTRLASQFIRRQRGKYGNVEERLFTKTETALAWLESQMVMQKHEAN